MSSTDFKLEHLADALKKCKQEDGSISMDGYIESYGQISRFLQLLGSIFTFVVSEVNGKVMILQGYRKASGGENYVSIDKMMLYEMKNDITTKNKENGSRTLLRLHRAFEFVMDFLRQMRFAEDDARLSDITRSSYDKTLSKFHPWIVRQGVYLAAYTLPKKAQFCLKLSSTQDNNKQVDRVLEYSKPVYDSIQELFVTNKLDNLP